jgi:hypothetical protein
LPIIHPAITMLLHSCPLVYSTRLCVRVGILYDSSTFASGRVQLGRATNFGILTKADVAATVGSTLHEVSGVSHIALTAGKGCWLALDFVGALSSSTSAYMTAVSCLKTRPYCKQICHKPGWFASV